MERLKKAIDCHLITQFERDLFDACLHNLQEKNNKLRFNNFAYSMRELTRHFLDRLSPDIDVLNAPWFEPYDKDKPKQITRAQRIKYAIQGWLSDEYIKTALKLNFEEVSRNLKKSIDELSKYTHVNPDTFNVEDDTILDTSYNVLSDTLLFFMTVTEAQDRVNKAVIKCIDEEMISSFYVETQQDLDILATHYEVLSYIIATIKETNRDDKNIFLQVDGSIHVRLQYGSDNDLKRDIGYETTMIFPFTSQMVANYKNKEGNVHIVDAKIQVNNDDFYE